MLIILGIHLQHNAVCAACRVDLLHSQVRAVLHRDAVCRRRSCERSDDADLKSSLRPSP